MQFCDQGLGGVRLSQTLETVAYAGDLHLQQLLFPQPFECLNDPVAGGSQRFGGSGRIDTEPDSAFDCMAKQGGEKITSLPLEA